MQKGHSNTMTTSFASSLKAREHLPAERLVLSLMHLHATDMTGLRRHLTTDPNVPAPVYNIASSSSHWNRLHASALAWSDPDSLPARTLDFCRAIVVRVFRTPDSVFDADRAKAKKRAEEEGGKPEDYMPRRPADWDGGPLHTRLRMLTALVGVHVLEFMQREHKPNSRPSLPLRNFALTMNMAPEGKSVKAQLDRAVERGLLFYVQPTKKGSSGKWVVRSLNDRTFGTQKNYWPKDAPLSHAEETIAQALFDGDEAVFAAALILNAGHIGFHYEPDGLAAWWLLARVAADPFHPRLSDDDERFTFKVRSMADVDALVSDEARAEKAARVPAREAEKAERNAQREANDAEVAVAWNDIRRELNWASLPSRADSLADPEGVRDHIGSWAQGALRALRRVPPEKQRRKERILSELRTALPKRLPAHGERAFAYLKEGLSQ